MSIDTARIPLTRDELIADFLSYKLREDWVDAATRSDVGALTEIELKLGRRSFSPEILASDKYLALKASTIAEPVWLAQPFNYDRGSRHYALQSDPVAHGTIPYFGLSPLEVAVRANNPDGIHRIASLLLKCGQKPRTHNRVRTGLGTSNVFFDAWAFQHGDAYLALVAAGWDEKEFLTAIGHIANGLPGRHGPKFRTPRKDFDRWFRYYYEKLPVAPVVAKRPCARLIEFGEYRVAYLRDKSHAEWKLRRVTDPDGIA